MASSVAALGTLLAVLFLPKIQQTLTDSKNLRAVQNELYENKRQMQIIVELRNSKNLFTDGSTGIEYALQIEAAAMRLSIDCWQRFKFELGVEAYSCLKPFFTSTYDVIAPSSHLATSGEQDFDPFLTAESRAVSADEFLNELAATAPKCRYLRIP